LPPAILTDILTYYVHRVMISKN